MNDPRDWMDAIRPDAATRERVIAGAMEEIRSGSGDHSFPMRALLAVAPFARAAVIAAVLAWSVEWAVTGPFTVSDRGDLVAGESVPAATPLSASLPDLGASAEELLVILGGDIR